MSSTKRKAGIGTDYYPTPGWVTRLFLDELGPERVARWGTRWLEPAVGDGAIIRTVDAWRAAHGLEPVEWLTVDVREVVGPAIIGSFPHVVRRFEHTFDVAITNPPFSQADAFVQSAIESARVAVLLLSANWPGTAKRNASLREHTPDMYLVPDRISFDRRGNDSVCHAWFVWGDRREGEPARWVVLPSLPRARRKS